jgi:lipid-binding SYLF domain-containing protein
MILPLGLTISVSAQKRSFAALAQTGDTKRMDEAMRHSEDAAKVFDEIMAVPDKSIPKDLLDKAEAVVVFPGVIKAAFVIGGSGGQGVISRRTRRGWSAPAFFKIGGASFGAQIGAEKIDYVLLIMNEKGLRGLLEDKFEIGGEASIAAGPVGRTASASTNVTVDAAILSYSRSKGAFIGISLKGGVINPDNDLNEAVYGMKARDILTAPQKVNVAQLPARLRAFPTTLARYSVR